MGFGKRGGGEGQRPPLPAREFGRRASEPIAPEVRERQEREQLVLDLFNFATNQNTEAAVLAAVDAKRDSLSGLNPDLLSKRLGQVREAIESVEQEGRAERFTDEIIIDFIQAYIDRGGHRPGYAHE